MWWVFEGLYTRYDMTLTLSLDYICISLFLTVVKIVTDDHLVKIFEFYCNNSLSEHFSLELNSIERLRLMFWQLFQILYDK